MLYDKESTRIDKSISPIMADFYYDKTCAVCGDSFKSGRPHGKYCSLRCCNDAYIARRRKHGIDMRKKATACVICSAPLSQTDMKIKSYCSNACKQKAYRMRKSNPNNNS